MSQDEIHISVSHTINLGNYENIKIEVGYTTLNDPSKKSNADVVMDLTNEMTRKVLKEGKRLRKKKS